MQKNVKEIQDALLAPFAREFISFRICRISAKKTKANVLAYITARGIMQRLDEVFGLENWQDAYDVLEAGVKCKLSVRISGEWITKQDVGPYTKIDAIKGAFSDSLKRAGVKLGIGRYLYKLPDYWVDLLSAEPQNTRYPYHYHNVENISVWWVEPTLPTWALPQQAEVMAPEVETKLNTLLQKKFLTVARYGYYIKLLSDPQLAVSQRDLAIEQLQLAEQWGNEVLNLAVIDTDLKKEIYRKILSSTIDNIEQVRAELTRLSATEQAA